MFALVLSTLSHAQVKQTKTAAQTARGPHATHAATAPAAATAALWYWQSPFDRVIRPGLDKIRAEQPSAIHPHAAAKTPVRAADTGAAPSFGGFLAAPKYQAWNAADEDASALVVFAAGDFNGDGKPDIVTVQNTGSINVLLNQGSGAFGTPVSTYFPSIYLGGAVQAFAVDVNKDGKLDLVLLDWVNNGIQVLPGNGDGTFTEPTFYAAGAWAVASIDVADVNGDGYPDIVQVSGGQTFSSPLTSTYEIDTLLNDGKGGFATPTGALSQSITVSGWTDTLYGRSVVLSDVNGDGTPDLTLETLAWLDTPTTTQDSTHVIQTLAGNGDGSFAAPTPATAINIPLFSTYKNSYPQLANLSVVDVNKDGVKDIVFSFEDHSIYVILGSGSGTYQAPVNVGALQAFPTDLTVADLNGDGLPELIDAEVGYVTVYENLGGGKFDNTVIPSYGSGVGYSSVLAAADFTGDGTPDVALMNSSEDSVTVFQGVTGSVPSLHAANLLNPPTSQANGAFTQAVLDANGDGNDDVVVFNTSPYTGTPELLTGLGDGKGNFSYKSAVAHYSPATTDFIDTQTGDFNGDGRPDLVLHTSQGVSLLLSNGDGTFTAQTESILPFACVTGKGALGDVNGDGKLDLVVAYGGDDANPTCEAPVIGQPATPSGVIVALGNGDGTFKQANIVAVGSQAFEPVLLDSNGDGKLDIAVSSLPFQLNSLGAGGTFDTYLLLGNGDGTFQAPINIAADIVDTHLMAGDVNGDGKTDLVILSAGTVDSYGNADASQAGVLTLLSNGDAGFDAGLSFTGLSASGGLLADLNGDGKLDLALSEYASVDFSGMEAGSFTALGNGDGTYAATGNFESGKASSTVLAGDFVKDTAPDLLYVSSTSGSSLLVNQGGVTVTLSAVPASIYQGQSVDVTAVVTAALAGKHMPTGTVTLLEAGKSLGSGPLSSGSATVTLTGLAQGTHTITAAYSGDGNYNASTGATITITVGPVPAVTIDALPLSLSLKRGQTGTVTFNATANGSFSGNVSFTVSGTPNGMSVFAPNPLSLTAGQSGSATLVISTTSADSSAVRWPLQAAGGGMALAGLFLLAIPHRFRKKFSALSMAVLGVLALAGVFGMTGCGSSIHAVPKGSYTLTVTATPDGLQAQTFTVKVSVQ